MAQNQVALCLVQSLPCTSNKFILSFASLAKLLWTFCLCLKKQEPIFQFPGYYQVKLKPLWNLISFQVIPKKKHRVQHFSVLILCQLKGQNSVIHILSEKGIWVPWRLWIFLILWNIATIAHTFCPETSMILLLNKNPQTNPKPKQVSSSKVHV